MAKPATPKPRTKTKNVLGIQVTRGDVPKEDWDVIHRFALALEKGRFNDYVEVLMDTKKLAWKSLVTGVARGFGAVLGATVVVALLVALLALLGDALPGDFGDFFSDTGNTLQNVTPGE